MFENKKKRKKSNPDLVEEIICTWQDNARRNTDVLGSYTGIPEDAEYPVQDADDL